MLALSRRRQRGAPPANRRRRRQRQLRTRRAASVTVELSLFLFPLTLCTVVQHTQWLPTRCAHSLTPERTPSLCPRFVPATILDLTGSVDGNRTCEGGWGRALPSRGTDEQRDKAESTAQRADLPNNSAYRTSSSSSPRTTSSSAASPPDGTCESPTRICCTTD